MPFRLKSALWEEGLMTLKEAKLLKNNRKANRVGARVLPPVRNAEPEARTNSIARAVVPLPSLCIECGVRFYSEALAHVRERRSDEDKAGAGDPATASSPRAPELDTVRPKYLETTRIANSKGLPLRRTPAVRSAARPPERKETCTVQLHVAEAPVCLIAVLDGVESRMAPGTWLLLESLDMTHDSEFCLSAEAGGGILRCPSTTSGERMVHFVDVDRLNTTAAEANLRRAERGLSVAALRHAALILKKIGESEAELYPDESPSPSLIDSEARAQRLECVVQARATAAAKRDTSVDSPSKQAFLGNDTSIGEQRLTMQQKGYQAMADFMQFGIRKFGNAVRLWFALDPEERMTIGEKQFARRCEEIAYKGNMTALWRYLDRDSSGHITILEIDSKAAIVLADFKNLLKACFNGCPTKALQFLDENNSLRVPKAEFVAGLNKLGYKGPARRLFDMLARGHLNVLTLKDLAFLERWSPPPYLFSEPDVKRLEALKEAMFEVHSSSLAAWWKVLDRDKTMRVSWEEFVHACAKIAKRLPENTDLPKTEDEMAAVWRALDSDCSGWIALREYDAECFRVLSSFKKWVDTKHGNIAKTMQAFCDDDAHVTWARFWKVLKQEQFSKDDAALIFDGLVTHTPVRSARGPVTSVQSYLEEGSLRFLDKWDLVWEEWESTGRGR
mmetsp:Transcript_112297/g.317407  ORF Transcript_112297/g.317407 Transcript_112297/m.317407 type:complete len:675 (-) Transcript_112297:95-2119(-)